MSGMFGKKEKRYSEPIRWKKELKLGPGYLLLTLWIFFTLVLLGWVLCASFSNTLTPHRITLVCHRRRSDLVLFKWLLYFF